MKKIKKILLIILLLMIGKQTVIGEIIYKSGDTAELVGKVIAFSGSTIPNKYVEANGQSLSTTAYPELFQTIGYTYGGSGTSFNVPNLNGRLITGYQTNLNDASYSYFNTVGKTGGSETVTLSADTMPSHTHTFTGAKHTHTFTGKEVTTSASGDHTHTASGTLAETGKHTHTFSGTTSTSGNHSHVLDHTLNNVNSTGAGHALQYGAALFQNRCYITGHTSWSSDAGAHNHTLSGTTASAGAHKHTFSGSVNGVEHTHTVTAAGKIENATPGGTNANTGGGKAHNNLQPYMTLKYIIKAK